MKIKKNSGFTLIEIIIAVTIIAIISVTGITYYGRETAKARANSDLYNAKQVGLGLYRAYIDGSSSMGTSIITSADITAGNTFNANDKPIDGSAGGLGERLVNNKYLEDARVFTIQGRKGWKMAYSLTDRGLVSVYVYNPANIGEYVTLYPAVSENPLAPYNMVSNK